MTAAAPRTTCVHCNAEVPQAALYCPACGARQDGKGAEVKRSSGVLSTNAFLGIGAAIAVVLGGVSFGLTRLALPDPAPQQATQQPDQHQHEHEQQAITPEQEAQRKAMRDSLIANPNNADLTLRFANFLFDLGEYESAADFYNRYIIRFDSTDADAYVDYGLALFRITKQDEAIQMTKRALDFVPNHQAALFNLGVMAVQMQDRTGALEWFSRCAEADSTSRLGQQARLIIERMHNPASN